MNTFKNAIGHLLAQAGLSDQVISPVRLFLLAALAVAAALLAGWLCRRIVIPLLLKLTAKTEARWDDVVFNRNVLLSVCRIVPAFVIWVLLPEVFTEHPAVHELLSRLTAIYITVMSVRAAITFADSFRLLEGERRSARQQYLYSFISVLKIILIFIAAIIVVGIAIDKDPSSLLAGLGAASAILMLAFQDTIKGLVAGVRLTSNDMLHKGDWITVPSAGANGRVEEISLTMVKVRNFDNTIVSVTPQTLVDGSFQNWLGMEQSDGRKVSRRIYFDFRNIGIIDNETRRRLVERGYYKESEIGSEAVNLTLFREYIERWIAARPEVNGNMVVLVRQAEATQAGLAVELNFWLKEKAGAPYERQAAGIMEYVFGVTPQFGLRIYQQFPEQ